MREYLLKLDLLTQDYGLEDIWFMQGDIGNKLYIHLYDDTLPIDLSGMRVVAFFENKQKQVSEKEVTIIEGENGVCELDVTNSILSVPGKIKVEIKLYKGEELKQTFFPFNIVSKKSIDVDNGILATTDLDVLHTINKNTTDIEELFEGLASTNIDVGNKHTLAMEEINKVSTQLQEDVSNKHTMAMDEISRVATQLQEDVATLNRSIESNVTQLNTSLTESIKNLSDNVGLSLEEVKTSIENTTTELTGMINTNVESINNTINEAISTINKYVEDTKSSIELELQNTATHLENQVQELDVNKIDVIISEVEPDVEGLRLGTIWIKPKQGDEV